MLAGESHRSRYLAAPWIFLCITAGCDPAFAYRPFDGTDAAVAEPGELEVELQPAGPRQEQGKDTLIAPWSVLNFGLNDGWEAVFEGRGETPLSPSGPTELIAAGAFLKHVVVPGSLQDKSGPSVATEFGVLLPGINDEPGVGASWLGIVSQRGSGRSRLRAGDLVHAVVEHDHDEVFGCLRGDCNQRAQVHQHRTGAVADDDFSLRLRQSDAQAE